MWRAGLSRVGLARFVRPQTNVCSNAQVRDHVLLAVFVGACSGAARKGYLEADSHDRIDDFRCAADYA